MVSAFIVPLPMLIDPPAAVKGGDTTRFTFEYVPDVSSNVKKPVTLPLKVVLAPTTSQVTGAACIVNGIENTAEATRR